METKQMYVTVTYNDAAFDAEINVLMEPYFDTRLSLEEFEDQELQTIEYKRKEMIVGLTIGLIMSLCNLRG